MFTVKLMRRLPHIAENGIPERLDSDGAIPIVYSTKIVQGIEVDVHRLRPNELYEISVQHDREGHNSAYYIADSGKPPPSGFAKEIEFYYAAYIENAQGATTEVVRF